MIFIPTIVFTLLGMLHYGKSFGTIEVCSGFKPQIDFGFLLLSVLLPLYTWVDTWTGLVCCVYFSLEYVISTYLYTHRTELFPGEASGSGLTHFNVMLGLHIVAWISQFIGHGIYERRAPALLDNILLIFVAPFFFVFEVLVMAFGYKEKSVREWNKAVAMEIKQFRDGKIKKRTE